LKKSTVCGESPEVWPDLNNIISRAMMN